MGRRRGFLPPPFCQQCGKAPDLGQWLWPTDKWRCATCLPDSLPGKDAISKLMGMSIESADEMRTAFDLEAKNLRATEARSRAEWARMMAVEMKNQGMARSRGTSQANGEIFPPSTERFLHDVVTIPDLAAVEAALDRNQLLLQSGTDVAAMALDAANSIQASNSLERMLAHQMAVLHKMAMTQMGRVAREPDAASQAKRMNAAARCMATFQQGLLVLRKIRQTGHQRITVQYVNVSHGGQAVIESIEKGSGGVSEPQQTMPTH